MRVGKTHLGFRKGMQKKKAGGEKLGELSLSQGHPTLFAIFHPMFYLEAILSYLVPHYRHS